MSSNGEDNKSEDGAAASSGNVGESRPFLDEHLGRDSPRSESVEYIRTIRKEIRRILPHIPDLTLLRWSGGKVRDPNLSFIPNNLSSSSDSKSESWSKSRMPPELRLDGSLLNLLKYFTSFLY